MRPVLGVIVPAFNEEHTIGRVLGAVLRQPCVQQVVVVDDGSTDGTAERVRPFVEDPCVTLLRHPVNRGKGAAIRTALESLMTPLVLIQDADLEYDPAEYERLIAPILEREADVVFGVRGFAGQTAFSYWFVVGNRLVTTAANILFNCYIQDLETGFKVMRTDLMRQLRLTSNRFDIEPEITGRALRFGCRIYEVPISYHARRRQEGKKLTWRDGLQALVTLFGIRLTPHRILFGANVRQAESAYSAAGPRLPDLPEEPNSPGVAAEGGMGARPAITRDSSSSR